MPWDDKWEAFRVWVPTESGGVEVVATRGQVWRLNVLGLLGLRVRPGLPLNQAEARHLLGKWKSREARLAKELAAARFRALSDPSSVEFEEGWKPGGERVVETLRRAGLDGKV